MTNNQQLMSILTNVGENKKLKDCKRPTNTVLFT
jgi:hypothetical protein